MRHALLSLLLLALPSGAATAAERWQILPPTPAPVGHGHHAQVNGVNLFYADVGSGSPVVVLHGGLANSEYLGHQVRALARHHRVIAVDSRGHGRSTRDDRPFSYDLMADDVVALLDALAIGRADLFGWSDGAVIGLDLAMRHPDRVGRIFAFGANTQTSGLKEGAEQDSVFARYLARVRREYAHLSPTPYDYGALQSEVIRMWEAEPNWTDDQLRSIRSPVMIVDGDHDEGIKREHTEYIAAMIPGARLLILPNVSHFAFLQDPAAFNTALLHFLSDQ